MVRKAPILCSKYTTKCDYLFIRKFSCARIQTLVNRRVTTHRVGDVFTVVVGDASVRKMQVRNVTVDSERRCGLIRKENNFKL